MARCCAFTGWKCPACLSQQLFPNHIIWYNELYVWKANSLKALSFILRKIVSTTANSGWNKYTYTHTKRNTFNNIFEKYFSAYPTDIISHIEKATQKLFKINCILSNKWNLKCWFFSFSLSLSLSLSRHTLTKYILVLPHAIRYSGFGFALEKSTFQTMPIKEPNRQLLKIHVKTLTYMLNNQN